MASSMLGAEIQGNFSLKIVPPVKEILNYYNENRRDINYVFPSLLHNVLTPMKIENGKHKILWYDKALKILAEKAGIAKSVTLATLHVIVLPCAYPRKELALIILGKR